MRKFIIVLFIVLTTAQLTSCSKTSGDSKIQYSTSREEMISELATTVKYPKELINLSWTTSSNSFGTVNGIALNFQKFDSSKTTDAVIKTIAEQSIPIIKASIKNIDDYDEVDFRFMNSKTENGILKTTTYSFQKDL